MSVKFLKCSLLFGANQTQVIRCQILSHETPPEAIQMFQCVHTGQTLHRSGSAKHTGQSYVVFI